MAFFYVLQIQSMQKEAAAVHVYNTNVKSYRTDPRLNVLLLFVFFVLFFWGPFICFYCAFLLGLHTTNNSLVLHFS